MNIVCPICNKEGIDKKHPYSNHKIKYADFIEKYYPKQDLWTKETLKYKDDSYFDTDFNSRTNLRIWLKNQRDDVKKNYCKELIIRRIKKKNLKYSITQTEAKSLIMPGVNYYQGLFGDYNKLSEELGLEKRFKYYPTEVILSSKDSKKDIIVDSREQLPFLLKHPIQIRTLLVGDYCLDDVESNVYIDRKSLPDAISSFIGGYNRIIREIERAAENNIYLIFLVEESIKNALNFNYLPHIHSKAKPEFLWHNIRGLLQKYKHIQICFADGRKEAARIAKRILFSNNVVKDIDIQLAIDLEII